MANPTPSPSAEPAANSVVDAAENEIVANCSAASCSRRRQIRKVFPQMRMEQQQRDSFIYQPEFVSIGPYHHGKQDLSEAEAFKHRCLNEYGPGKDILYDCIVERIREIRDCYAEVSIVENYDDNALAWMMVLDSCFIITYMEATTNDSWDDWVNCFGLARSHYFVPRDIMVLENQIPFFVLKLVIGLKYAKEQGRELVNKAMMGWISYEGYTNMEEWELMISVSIPREDEDPPLHFLEAFRRATVENSATDGQQEHDHESSYHSFAFSCFKYRPKFMTMKPDSVKNSRPTNNYGWGSVMDLKAKGISFRASASHSLRDIKFVSQPFSGQLHLPTRFLSDRTPVILANMIAYEVSPDSGGDDTVLSYAIFMKSLIQTVDDVKELQNNRVFRINRLSNQQQVVELFRNINTFGVGNMNIYEDVMRRVGQHCNNRARTWMADLVHGKLNNPWTIMGLLSASLLIVLTFLQTLYALHPFK